MVAGIQVSSRGEVGSGPGVSLAPVSVVIPTHDRAPLLAMALDSVLTQTLRPREIVVADDASTDGTAEVVAAARRRAERADPPTRVSLVRLPRRSGPSTARNRGCEVASSPLVAFLDSDDVWLPERLERQLRALDAAPGAAFAFCGVEGFDEHGRVSGARLRSPRRGDGDFLADLLEGTLLAASALVVQLDALRLVGGFRDIPMGEDYELSLRLAARWPASYVADVLVLKRLDRTRAAPDRDALGLRWYVRTVNGFLGEHPSLPGAARLGARRGLANAHLKLARLAYDRRGRSPAMVHLRAAARARPWDRRVASALARALLRLA